MLGDRFIDTWLALSCLCSGIHYIASSEMNTDEKDVAEVIEHMTEVTDHIVECIFI